MAEPAPRRTARGVRPAVLLLSAAGFLAWADASAAAVRGTVRNATNGKPAAGVHDL